ncbi:MAG: hypothetical protein ACYDHP_11505 [Ferrimicrobium sp.]
MWACHRSPSSDWLLLSDEPTNGLDPEGIPWVHAPLRGVTTQSRAASISSHLMGEMALIADYLVVICKGRLIATSSNQSILVRTPDVTYRAKHPLIGAQ